MRSILKAVFLCLALVPVLARPQPASAFTPVPGSAVVDGNYGEWNLVTDFFSNMYRAGNPSKPIESKAYLRYNCHDSTLYVLVLTEPNIPALIISGTAWVAVNAQNNKVVTDMSGNNGIPPDFAWIGVGYDGNATHARGYEASFKLPTGTYNLIVHVDVFDAGATQTSGTPGFPGTGPSITLTCLPVPAVPTTWSLIKSRPY